MSYFVRDLIIILCERIVSVVEVASFSWDATLESWCFILSRPVKNENCWGRSFGVDFGTNDLFSVEIGSRHNDSLRTGIPVVVVSQFPVLLPDLTAYLDLDLFWKNFWVIFVWNWLRVKWWREPSQDIDSLDLLKDILVTLNWDHH